MKKLIVLIMITFCAYSQDARSIHPLKDSGLALAAASVMKDESHKDAVQAILKMVGLSFTGEIYYIGEIIPTSGIQGFCRGGESVLEYRTTHLFNQTMAVVWYNPTNQKLHYLYCQKTPIGIGTPLAERPSHTTLLLPTSHD